MFNRFLISQLVALALSCFLFAACKKSPVHAVVIQPTITDTSAYQTSGTKITYHLNPVQLIGANAFHVFGAGGSDMKSWHMDIAREFIGNAKETPVSGGVIKDSNGSYLHSLQTVVDSNRRSNRITIICAFGWDGTQATLFTGRRPTQTAWWGNFQTVLQQWAAHFKNQPDVWIEVWNEPYRYDRTDGYTDDVWMSDMNSLTGVIRNTGNNNIILIPCAEQGQDESVLNNKGPAFLTGKMNILFDAHAYEKWLMVSDANIGARLGKLKQNNIPVIFGETAPMNAGALMNPQSFLDSVYNRGLSVCAWVWKNDDTDLDALRTSAGLPNNTGNNNWGSLYQDVALRVRKP
ncbi:cellulase family glycosylhydrolase [uncultured Mucilaginibacter sp.]|uniref:cellulase family glycosylhydrolase n=1 Tax=uncultured Mucilaginibacter sp. TaxID=797541 RepID=UPI0025CB80F2|nr:cellulase family glycosylhydrolase [uncultured Mucilaginibacter sp.]